MRKWKICMRFDNGATQLLSVTLKDIAAFIKKSVTKNDCVKKRNILPINMWLIDMVFDKAMKDCPTAELIDATISKRG